MAESGTLHDAFIDELKDAYDAKKQLTKALGKLAKAATSPARSPHWTSGNNPFDGRRRAVPSGHGRAY